jgi:hypothetical protein
MKRFREHMMVMLVGLIPISTACADEPVSITLRVTGLFSATREADLRRVVEELDTLKIERIDFDRAEVTFAYDTNEEPFKEADAEKLRTAIDNLLKRGSKHTFGALLPSDIPVDKLERVEIGVAGLDCKACGYAAYRAIFQIDGVVRATASFKDGLVSALIEPGKTDRAALEEALEKRGVELKEDYEFDGNGISREVLENYLDRSVTMAFYLVPEKPEGRRVYPFHDDDVRFIRNTGAKFIGRAIYRWGGESRLNSEDFWTTAKSLVDAVHAFDPDVVFQGCLFEIVTRDVDQVKIPAWVFDDFGLPVEDRHFSYEAMLNDDGKFVDHWRRGSSVPDVSKVEAQLCEHEERRLPGGVFTGRDHPEPMA